MSTLPNRARLSPNWKEEVNQRIAAHKNRKSAIAPEQGAAPQENQSTSNRASAAAARVAARFAKAPSYGDLLEIEARAAVRAAEAMSRAALQAQAAAESVLAELQAAKAAQPEWQSHQDQETVASEFHAPIEDSYATQFDADSQTEPTQHDSHVEQNYSYQVLWEPDAPPMHPAVLHSDARPYTTNVEGERESPGLQQDEVRIVEPDQPIHANLIQFPREIVATRKARPRRIEGPLAEQHQSQVQLSIFEVEPESISTEPAASETMSAAAAPTWMEPEWSGLELGEHPVFAMREDAKWEQLEEAAAEPFVYRGIPQAPWTLKLMAAVVDGSLITGAFVLLTYEIVSRMHTLPGKHPAELIAGFGLLLVNVLYIVLFNALGSATPGMRYAQIALCSFDGELPTRRMRFQRLAALGLSVLPMGMGILWSLFDEDHLSWHDRLSRTYLRAY